jgi:hypothetical protein
MTMPGYTITQKDIDGMIRFLKSTDLDNATPEMAIELLEHLNASIQTMSHENPEKLEALYEEFKATKKSKVD